MIPADVDVDALRTQLIEDGIAFGTANPVNAPLEVALRDTLAATDSAQLDPVAVVVLEHTPVQVADLRDLAQDLMTTTPFETVIVRTPHAASAVSENLTRHQIEDAQRAMVAQPDYPEGLSAFLDSAQATSPNWLLVITAVVIGLAAVFTVAFMQGRRSVKP